MGKRVEMNPTLELPVRCPICNSAPCIRVPVEERDLALQQDPNMVKVTYRCQQRHCREVYEIYVRDYQRAA